MRKCNYYTKEWESVTKPSRSTVIRILYTNLSPILSGLHCLTETASANYITWNKAYSLFPNSMLREESIWLGGRKVDYDQLVSKYQDKGWKVIMPSPLEYDQESPKSNALNGKRLYVPFIANEARWIADKQSWIIKHPELPLSFLSGTVKTPKVPDMVTELNFFTITTNFCRESYEWEGRDFYSIESEPYYTTSLKHCYGNTHRNDFALEQPSFWSYINNQLISYSQKQEFDKLTPQQMRTLRDYRVHEVTYLQGYHETYLEDFPPSWEFLDENGQISRLFEEWRKMRGLGQDEDKELQGNSHESKKPIGPPCFRLWRN
ncbi:hypothetical protein NHQ30_005790 [Ciborinia camelliae]|nr:hypothetical protein NHQ30_005790 [Ciborinia camelliae]